MPGLTTQEGQVKYPRFRQEIDVNHVKTQGLAIMFRYWIFEWPIRNKLSSSPGDFKSL
jgi:hypothetical protein